MRTEEKPLADKVIVITRSAEDSDESAEKFRRLGAGVILFPTIEVLPPDDWSEFDNNIKRLSDFDFLVFTSANSVRMFIKRCYELNVSLDFSNITTACVGKRTSEECKKNNIIIDIVPEKFSAMNLFEELTNYNLKGKKIFIPGSAIARDDLRILLGEKEAIVTSVPIYKLGIPSGEALAEKIKGLKNIHPDLYIFTSPSTFRNFIQIMDITEPEVYFNKAEIAVIGPTTKAEVENSGLNAGIIPDEYTMDGLLKSVINYYKENKIN